MIEICRVDIGHLGNEFGSAGTAESKNGPLCWINKTAEKMENHGNLLPLSWGTITLLNIKRFSLTLHYRFLPVISCRLHCIVFCESSSTFSPQSTTAIIIYTLIFSLPRLTIL